MPATGPTGTVPVTDWRDWRAWPASIAGLWRRSMRFRTIVITIALSVLAIVSAFVTMALAIQTDLFDSRRAQILDDASRAVTTVQSTLDAAEVEPDRRELQTLMNGVSRDLPRLSSSDVFAVFRVDQAPSQTAPQGFVAGGLTAEFISPELREQVQHDASHQWWQSVAMPGTDVPGIVVGQQVQLPVVGAYEVYLVYDLADAQQTLQFVQATLWLVGIVLVLIIGGIAWFVLRSVARPISAAAQTSSRFAAGDHDVRLPVRGEDELATLGRSFNAMADSIQAQIKELADLSLVQQRFVSDVSHELRTPLTTIRLAADMINDHRDDFDAATARAAELLHAQVERFEVLLGDLLEISRYDAGSVQLELEPTSLAHLAEDVIASMQTLIDQHGNDVRLFAPGGYSPVDMDARRVRRIVRNLLGNAIEHGEGRPIVVTVDSDQSAVAIGVRDFGLGMTPADAERVFDRFWRADPSRKRSIGGTGLGLSIALGDAHLHGGRLEVWSELGRGTNFVLTLPRDARGAGGDGATLTSPIPVQPAGTSTDDFGATQPIEIVTGSVVVAGPITASGDGAQSAASFEEDAR